MKYTLETIIDVPLDKFISIYSNTDHLKSWQRGLINIEHLRGTPGEYGAKMKMIYNIGGKVMELIETVESANLPDLYSVIFHTPGVDHQQQNHFSRTSEGGTKWVSINEYFPLNLKMRLFTLLMPKSFKRQSQLYMKDLKNYAENGTEVPKA